MDDETGREKYGGIWDSSTFRAIWEEGFLEGLAIERRRSLLAIGTEEFGPPDSSVAARIDRLDDPDVLRDLLRGVQRASSWQELLAPLPER